MNDFPTEIQTIIDQNNLADLYRAVDTIDGLSNDEKASMFTKAETIILNKMPIVSAGG